MKAKKLLTNVLLSIMLTLALIPATSYADDYDGESDELKAQGEPCNHSFYESYRVEGATSCDSGYIVYVCSKCQQEKTEYIPATHCFDEWYEIYEPECTSSGLEERSCWECGYTETREIPPLGHDWSETDLFVSDYFFGFKYGQYCERDGCDEERYTTYKKVKKGKSKKLLGKKQLRSLNREGFKKIRFYSSKKKIVKINKNTGKMKGKKRGKAVIKMKFTYQGVRMCAKFRVVVK